MPSGICFFKAGSGRLGMFPSIAQSGWGRGSKYHAAQAEEYDHITRTVSHRPWPQQ